MIPSMSVHVFKKTGKGFDSSAKVVNLKGTVYQKIPIVKTVAWE
jgi:hypothetical protein